MRIMRRGLSALFGTAGAVGLILCIAGIVGCWMLRAESMRYVNAAFGRAEGSLDGMRDGLGRATDRLQQTREDLDTIGRREAELAASAPEQRTAGRSLLRRQAEKAVPQLAAGRRQLVKATETALVLNGLLDALAELPGTERVGIEVDGLQDASDKLEELIQRSEKLAAMLAESSPNAAASPAPESSRIRDRLERILGVIAAGGNRVELARTQLQTWHAKIDRGLTAIAVGTTAILAWIGLGQLGLITWGIRLWRSARLRA